MMDNSIQYKHRNDKEKQLLKRRLNIIEGQVRGIKQMIEDDRYCNDILIQISAVNESLNSLGKKILKNHLSTCVVSEIKSDHLEVIDEVMSLFQKLN